MSRTFCPLWPRRPGCPGPPGCPGLPCRDTNRIRTGSLQHSEASAARVTQMKPEDVEVTYWPEVQGNRLFLAVQDRLFPLGVPAETTWTGSEPRSSYTSLPDSFTPTVTSSSCPSLTLCSFIFALFLFIISFLTVIVSDFASFIAFTCNYSHWLFMCFYIFCSSLFCLFGVLVFVSTVNCLFGSFLSRVSCFCFFSCQLAG